MQVTLQGLFSPDEGNAVTVETNSQATVQTLVSAFCSQRGVAYNHKLEVFDGSKRPLPLQSTLQSAGVVNGQSLYIGYRSRSISPKKPRWPVYLAILALIIGVTGILTMSLVYGLYGGVIPFDYGVVMDAGSSKTNTLLYRWLGSKYRNTGCVSQVTSCVAKGKGIASQDPENSIPRILDCAGNITERIDPKKIASTPLYFSATAGMRLLNFSHPDKVLNILQQLEENLNNSGLAVKSIAIISGKEEGVYDWISANYLKKTLDVKNTNPFTPVTYGALDMGGASCQIAFAVPPTEENTKNPIIEKLTLYGENHDVYAKSHLCFGRREAERRYRSLLIEDPRNEDQVDPCAPEGSIIDETAQEILNSPCTETKKFADWFDEDSDLKDRTYHFHGKSDYEECERKVKQLMDKDSCDEMNFNSCFDNLPRQLEDQKFVAFASYFYTTDYLKLRKSTLEQYEEVTREFCKKRFDQIPDANEFTTQYCFNAVYIHEVLVNGYGFNSTTWKNLEFIGKIDGKEIAWALGYMINATNAIPLKKPSERLIDPTLLTVCIVIFIVVVAATMVYIFHSANRKKKEEIQNGSAQSLYQSP